MLGYNRYFAALFVLFFLLQGGRAAATMTMATLSEFHALGQQGAGTWPGGYMCLGLAWLGLAWLDLAWLA